jgi:hypothetical protein
MGLSQGPVAAGKVTDVAAMPEEPSSSGRGKKLLEMKKKFGGSVRNKATRLKKWKKSGTKGMPSDNSTCQSDVTDEMSMVSSSAFSLLSTLSAIENRDNDIMAMMPKAAKMQPSSSHGSQRIVRRNKSNLPSRRRRPTVAEI